MDNRGFFKLLNSFYKGQPMQFIPAPLATTTPPLPFATYQIRDSENDIIRIDERDISGDKIVYKASVRTEEEIIIKCYHKNDTEAYRLSKEVMDLISFKLREEINRAGYGILLLEQISSLHEKTEAGYIYCYAVNLTIDYNHLVTKEVNKLKTIELKGDIEEIINLGGKK